MNTNEQLSFNEVKDKLDNRDIEQAIVMYLAEHPAATDTLWGICNWWVMRQQVRVSINALQEALTQLTKSNVLEVVGTGELALYRLKHQNAELTTNASELTTNASD